SVPRSTRDGVDPELDEVRVRARIAGDDADGRPRAARAVKSDVPVPRHAAETATRDAFAPGASLISDRRDATGPRLASRVQREGIHETPHPTDSARAAG